MSIQNNGIRVKSGNRLEVVQDSFSTREYHQYTCTYVPWYYVENCVQAAVLCFRSVLDGNFLLRIAQDRFGSVAAAALPLPTAEMADERGGGGGARGGPEGAEAALRLESDDGTEEITTAVEQRFLEWLAANGATLPKIQWPARDTVSSVRGAVALADIAGGEKDMMCIPTALVMSPASAQASPTIGHVFVDGEAFKHAGGYGKFETTVFLMHEKVKGASSFWHPYIASLPEPRTVADWNAAELAQLQHSSFLEELPDQERIVTQK